MRSDGDERARRLRPVSCCSVNQTPPASLPGWAERWVRVLDDGLRIPGTSLRFGLDAVLGLFLPEVGDVIAAVSGLSLIWLAIRQHAPKRVIARMLLNLALDALIGAIPVLGDVFDFGFKANRRNLDLLKAHTRGTNEPLQVGALGYAWLAFAVLVMLCSLAVPLTVGVLLARWLFG